MKLGFVGNGTVGRALALAFAEHVSEVRIYDVVTERRTHPRDEVFECDLTFICAPESEVESVVRGILPEERDRKLVIKSTVSIGTTRRLSEQYGLTNLCHSPEFLTARSAAIDAQTPARLVIGVPPSDHARERANACAASLLLLYRGRFPGVPIFPMRSDESEALKLADNAFGAVKVSFFNELYSLCEAGGLDWHVVRNALLAGGRIGLPYTSVPGPDARRGWGGHCWIKDAAEFVRALERLGLPADVTAGAIRRNEWDRQRGS